MPRADDPGEIRRRWAAERVEEMVMEAAGAHGARRGSRRDKELAKQYPWWKNC